jgi:hypothetical protein
MYQLRKCEKFTSWQAGPAVTLDPEKFRNLSIPYEGDCEQDFLDYIASNAYDLEEMYDELDEETRNQMESIWHPEMLEYSNSTWKFEDSWYEIGKENSEYTKYGGFESTHDTLSEY